MNETFTGAAQVDADASPQADGAPSAARIVTGLSRLPGSFWPLRGPHRHRAQADYLEPLRGPHRHRAQVDCPALGRYAARIVTGLELDCPVSPRRYAARIVTGLRLDCPASPRPLRGPHRHRAQAGLPGFSSAATRPASSPG
ncbi:hypothetical protein [Mycobacterium tuberculosis]|uniref:hypothetical protein n=1 Tax=Mycobacterium tuberculosis TaxID=1773 RepID=UPI003D7C3399